MQNKNKFSILLILPIIIILIIILINNNEVNTVPIESSIQRQAQILGEDVQSESSESADNSEVLGEKNMQDQTNSQDESTEQNTSIKEKQVAKDIVVLNTTLGSIKLRLNSSKTPKTVNNFISLAQKGFYDGTIFHRVMEDFMIQGGDPNGDGTGGPGYTIEDEPFEGEYKRGTLAMARTSAPNSAGSQFFIMHKDYALPKQYVIFGEVIEGIEVVDLIATAPVERSQTGEMSKPVNPVSIESIEITRE